MTLIRDIVQPELGWDDNRWATEEAAYLVLVETAYGLPDRTTIPDWKSLLAQTREERAAAVVNRREHLIATRRRAGLGLLLMALVFVFVWLWRHDSLNGDD